MNENIYFRGEILGLGDSIAFVPLLNLYSDLNQNKNIFFSNRFNFIFEKNIKNVFFINHEESFFKKNDTHPFIYHKNKIYNLNEIYTLGYTTTHLTYKNEGIIKEVLKNKRLPLQKQFANFINIKIEKELKPKIILNNFEKPFEKYVCIATQTTTQGKYWNHKNGWEKVINYLKYKGYEVVCIDKHQKVGNLVHCNYIPQGCIDMTNKNLNEVASIIHNSEFFIGLDSGLSWLAWALNKKVIQILGLTGKRIAFENPYAILNENVCNSCFEDESIEIFSSDSPFSEFLMCPRQKNTEKMFECTKTITPEMVIKIIKTII